jgi:AraC-like DNA-binding protein/ligand-binding sensor protein
VLNWRERLSAKDDFLPGHELHSPLLAHLSQIVRDTLGAGYLIIHPSRNGWDQVYPDDDVIEPEFCHMVQSVEEGAKNCRMCHILMSIAARTQGTIEHRCHAGPSVFVAPVDSSPEEGNAILSTCVFRHGDAEGKWQEVKAYGEKMGLPLPALRKAYEAMPVLDDEKVRLMHSILAAAAEAVREIRGRIHAEAQVKRLLAERSPRVDVQSEVERELRLSASEGRSDAPRRTRGKRTSSSLLIDVVTDMIGRRPHLPFTVGEIAAAARLSPAYFSSIFHKHCGLSFSDFLTEKRMELAKSLLRDLTLNINEVALRSGYEDPGYFARRFKQQTDLSPRDWRRRFAGRAAG